MNVTIASNIGVKILPKRSTILFGLNESQIVTAKNTMEKSANANLEYESGTNGETAISNETVAVRGTPKNGPSAKYITNGNIMANTGDALPAKSFN